MTHLIRYDDAAPFGERERTGDFAAIAAALAPAGVVLERWTANAVLPADPSDEAVLSAYAGDVERLKAAGYPACDVLRMRPDHPQRAALRTKFLDEHIHDDDEVRFFVEGAGLFYIRSGGSVYALECTAGDLIVLPAGTQHWFDTGAQPDFTAIRFFITPEGWVARYTGDPIAASIPQYEQAQ